MHLEEDTSEEKGFLADFVYVTCQGEVSVHRNTKVAGFECYVHRNTSNYKLISSQLTNRDVKRSTSVLPLVVCSLLHVFYSEAV